MLPSCLCQVAILEISAKDRSETLDLDITATCRKTNGGTTVCKACQQCHHEHICQTKASQHQVISIKQLNWTQKRTMSADWLTCPVQVSSTDRKTKGISLTYRTNKEKKEWCAPGQQDTLHEGTWHRHECSLLTVYLCLVWTMSAAGFQFQDEAESDVITWVHWSRDSRCWT